jgi:hypothetical protein
MIGRPGQYCSHIGLITSMRQFSYLQSLITLNPKSMFLQIDESHLVERQFEKVYIKDDSQQYSTYYYKQGIYVKFFFEGYYDVYNNAMTLIGTVNNIYRLEIFMTAQSYPLNMN